MSWPCTLIDRVRPVIVLTSLWWAASAAGQSLESVISPGAVAKTHEEIEHECGKCHVRFSPSAQPKLCLDCHRAVAADRRDGTGYHGRVDEPQCRRCHTEHKGRTAKIVVLDEKKFDHRRTDFQLRGDHQGKPCAGCHRPGVKHRDAATDCASCHRGNDLHRGGLGERCDSCHVEDNWKLTRFDHARTRYPLLFRHAQQRCAACHPDEHYAGTPRDCVACHRNDDAHGGDFGSRCESCHTEQDWRGTIFRHDRETRFPLLGQHRITSCSNCHRGPLYREAVPTQCVSCHQAEDAHRTVFGQGCASCHSPDGWREASFDHTESTGFPLRYEHLPLRCESCHNAPNLQATPVVACLGCHERDERERGHRGRLGGRCENCHQELAWSAVTFDHERDTKFQRAGKHRSVRCDGCHPQSPYLIKTKDQCVACHEMDDIHLGSFEQECDGCHVADDWRKIRRAATDQHCRPVPPASAPAGRAASGVSFWIPACLEARRPAPDPQPARP